MTFIIHFKNPNKYCNTQTTKSHVKFDPKKRTCPNRIAQKKREAREELASKLKVKKEEEGCQLLKEYVKERHIFYVVDFKCAKNDSSTYIYTHTVKLPLKLIQVHDFHHLNKKAHFQKRKRE